MTNDQTKRKTQKHNHINHITHNNPEELSLLSLSLLNPPHFSFAMDFHVYGLSRLVFISSVLVFFVGICLALPDNPNLRSSSPANNSGQINSNSVLVANVVLPTPAS